MTEEQLVGRFGLDLHKNYPSEKERAEMRLAIAGTGTYQSEVLYKTGKGNEFWGSLALREISIRGSKFHIVRVTDITAQHESNEKVKSALHEKEVLLAEIHHRVKNNLAVVSGLLGLQATYVKDEQARSLFEESRSRIHSMAIIHDKLYQHETFATIDFSSYINDLVSHIKKLYNNIGTKVSFEIVCNDIYLDIKNAVPCGLILNELISNSFKHAFPGREEGLVKIVCTRMGERFTMMVSDDGVGYDMDKALQNPTSLGLTLISALAGQVNGNLKTTFHQGTAFYLSFEV
jgi:two-component sensor histidine kinase